MSKTTSDSITLTLADISGSIAEAIIEACKESDYLASGQIGPSFATSGPGSGWSTNYDASDYAERALSDEYGATGYVDPSDGRLATLDDEGAVEWSDESVVSLDAPEAHEVDDDMDNVRLMIEALDSGLCIEGSGDWDEIRALAKVSEEEALERHDMEIVGDSVIYYDDGTRKWYRNDRADVRELRALMGSSDQEIAGDAYSHWCAGYPSEGEYDTQDEARESAAE